ncbi:MAG: hypothetical protein WBF87_10310, partial [Mesorhizobium sp.]
MDNDNTGLAGGRLFKPSMVALFVPAAVFALIYLVALAGLVLAGQWNSPVAALLFVSLSATPLMVAYAILRRVTTQVAVLPHAIHVEPGFPRGDSLEVPYD